MRDRLIELLSVPIYPREGADPAEVVADYLLDNGIIVPPCKVGDTVYQVTRNFISEFRVRFIEIATCGNLFLHTDLISGIIYTGEIFPVSEIGKAVFLTREAAALRKEDEGK